ncbi:MAG: DUF1549 domain-containing protein [Planctomycetaceae bacterium]
MRIPPRCLSSLLIVCLAATGHADEQPSADGIAFFETHIRPLLAERCYSCHSGRSGKSEGGLRLDHRDGWKTGGDNGRAIVPGDVTASLLIRAVSYGDRDLQMPPDKALSDQSIQLLKRWVKMGAPDPRDRLVDEVPGTAPSDPVAGRQHWAFQPLNTTPPPNVQQSQWLRSPIDAYVLAKQEIAQLSPAADADARTLARRTYFQLLGLPPTSQQMDRFLADDRPNAFADLVDQLLASPQFGERWGRHWLDLARYADSNGLDENFLFREAWRYRNWVIAAFNADMSYDEFLRQQIAGDLLPFDSIEQRDQQRIAAGFLVIGPKVLLGNDPNGRIMDVADEQLDTIGKTVLGQTMGCARCHDHKFDPIPTADYYAMAGIFTSTQVMEQRYMLGQQRVMEQLVGLGPDGDQIDGAYEAYWQERDSRQQQLKQGQSALEFLQKDNTAELEAFAVKHPKAVADGVLDPTLPKADRIAAQTVRVAELEAAATAPPIPPRAMIPTDKQKPADEAIRVAGKFDHPGDKVARGVLRVVSDTPITIPDGQSGRLELANWLTHVDDGAGRLAARVYANRIWQHLMGRGLVRTVDNFGRTGEEPSHQELLDYLASRLIQHHWSTKALIREIVLSHTFAISSQHDAAAFAVDPDNTMLWRANRRRLDPESLRDAMLLSAGTLDLTPLESTVSYLGDQATAVGENKNRRRTDFPCRSVYLPVIRNDLPEVFEAFDFADPHATTGLRPETIVATQGLFMLNDVSVMDAAEATARRIPADVSIKDPADVADAMFAHILNVPPEEFERTEVAEFIRTTSDALRKSGDAEPEFRAVVLACQAVFASSRFQILE